MNVYDEVFAGTGQWRTWTPIRGWSATSIHATRGLHYSQSHTLLVQNIATKYGNWL